MRNPERRNDRRYALWYYRFGFECYHDLCYFIRYGQHPPEGWEVWESRIGEPGPDGPPCAICGQPIEPEEQKAIIDD
jgi:hypothetical protein